MKRNTTISTNLQHTTKFIDPRSGRVLREGSTPMSTVGEFKSSPTVAPVDNTEMEELKLEMVELKALLKESLKK